MPTADDLLKDRFEVLSARLEPLEDILAANAPRIRGIMTRGGEAVPGALIERLPALEIIANLGVGYDAVDAPTAARRGIMVTNTPEVLNDEVADFTIGLLLATIREIPQSDAYVRAGNWPDGPFRLSASLRDRTIGIVGMGQIGQAIARRLEAFGRPIAYHSRRKVEGLAYAYHPTVVELAASVDVLIAIVPGGPATKGMIDAAVLSALGPNGVLINVARGSVVDEAALVKALAAGEIAAAGLDVFEREPRPSPELLAFDNVVLCPHIGSGTHHTRGRMAALGVENLTSWFAGKGPVTPVAETPWPRPAA
ncbi:2-hydroxyacid dehydrogenase [Hansschlegelia zhihuaiae]|uniref:2-hydroxyacid dehydrogenase n=1 Tax=Hansschlegelia zhihuaiae TaxID=405005 RepID=A0A4V1KJH6_9HYPH|nr:2-hydroxyacid dehydrogenase [Hansschlegelia zhihuaiae]